MKANGERVTMGGITVPLPTDIRDEIDDVSECFPFSLDGKERKETARQNNPPIIYVLEKTSAISLKLSDL